MHNIMIATCIAIEEGGAPGPAILLQNELVEVIGESLGQLRRVERVLEVVGPKIGNRLAAEG